MTREIRVCERVFQREATSAHITASAHGKNAVNTSVLAKICKAYKTCVRVKKDISDAFVSMTEELADKTAREGLFGEDRGKNYLGTSVDYISD